ncbi:hypothetical protein [Nocardia noduli]|uniref:hypothetical protein n=1 Tax=Nocardia noduli TaxID=2815722 RepID=UPI001C210F3B|nr:hypothetical protein [Nocardia noduli]
MEAIPDTRWEPKPYDWPELPAIEGRDEWIEGRRYLGLDVLARSRGLTDPATEQEDATAALTA